MSLISVVSMNSIGVERAEDHSPRSIALFCCIGLMASLCLVAFGVDLGAGWV